MEYWRIGIMVNPTLADRLELLNFVEARPFISPPELIEKHVDTLGDEGK